MKIFRPSLHENSIQDAFDSCYEIQLWFDLAKERNLARVPGIGTTQHLEELGLLKICDDNFCLDSQQRFRIVMLIIRYIFTD